jgi:hypothetical protein
LQTKRSNLDAVTHDAVGIGDLRVFDDAAEDAVS